MKKCPYCYSEMDTQASICPSCKKKVGKPNKNGVALKRRPWLWALYIIGALWILGAITGQKHSADDPSPEISHSVSDSSLKEPSAPSTPVLELQAWNWHKDYDYADVQGEVKNISDHNLDNVEAVATFTDQNGHFITSEEALIQYRPLLPGQTSPFEVMVTYNPSMNVANIDFKSFNGGSINWKKK